MTQSAPGQRFVRKLRSFRDDEAGASAVVFALTLPMIAGLLFMGVEAGHWRQENAKLQSAADAAVIAAALEYTASEKRWLSNQSAFAVAMDNGAGTATSFKIKYGSISSGDYAGEDGVELTMWQEQNRYFSSIFGERLEPVTHQLAATALIGASSAPLCVLALNPTQSAALNVTGNADINMTGCGLHSNSTGSPSIGNNGSGTITADCISAVGTVTGESRMTLDCPAPRENQRTATDPYSDVDMPANWTSLPCSTPKKSGKDYTFYAGERYCGGSLNLQRNVTFSGSGYFIFDGMDIKIQAHASVRGHTDGVALLFANDATISGNGGDIDLNAMTTGDYAGVLMYGDRDTQSAGNTHKINGNQDARLEGLLYFPNEELQFNGGADMVSNCTLLVANTVDFKGNAGLTNTGCDTGYGLGALEGPGNTKIVLVR